MHDRVDTALRTTLDELFPSLELVQPAWDRVVADAGVMRSRRGRGRRLVFRVALAGAAAAAIALGALSLLPGSGASAVARAEAALTGPRDAILHAVAVGSFSNRDGGTTTWTIETWQHNSPPYDSRWVLLGGIRRPESAMAGGVRAFYDARTNTIYTANEPVGKPGSARVPDPLAATFSVDDLRDLLRSGDAREEGRVRVDGRDAIRVVATQPALTLLVDAETFEPLEWRVAGDGREVRMRIHTYEWLPATAENETLLSLSAQHPGAAVRSAPTDDAERADAGASAK